MPEALSTGTKETRYQELLKAGFAREWIDRVARERPHLYDEPGVKIDGLKARGFDNPIKLITQQPPILGLSFDNIDAKLGGLKQRGFGNPVKLITRQPAILAFTFENIDAKIQGLRARGFADPIKLVTTMPAIFGLSFDNIDRKVRLLYLLHGDRTKAVREIEAFPPLLAYKWRRLLFVVRASHPDALRRLITISPRLLAAAKGIAGSSDPATLRAEAHRIKNNEMEQLLAQLVDDEHIEPRLIRALDRI